MPVAPRWLKKYSREIPLPGGQCHDTVVHWMIQKDEIAEELFRQRPRKRMKGQYQFSGRLTALRE